MLNNKYFLPIGFGITVLISVGSAVYSYALGKRFKEAIDVIDDYNEQIEANVEEAVNEAYEETKEDVKKELTRQILNLDISEIKKEVVDQASEKVKSKLQLAAEEIMKKGKSHEQES